MVGQLWTTGSGSVFHDVLHASGSTRIRVALGRAAHVADTCLNDVKKLRTPLNEIPTDISLFDFT